MANSYCALNVHYIFSTKDREPWITDHLKAPLWAYLGGVVGKNNMKALCVGGVADHVHILVSLPTTISVARAIQLVKGNSSKWIHETFPGTQMFAWQSGYGAFSVSMSKVPEIVSYIARQQEHHRSRTFQEEYLSFLKKHQIDYDERYLWI